VHVAPPYNMEVMGIQLRIDETFFNSVTNNCMK